MKKTLSLLAVAAFALAFGVVYANAGTVAHNGVTDFSGLATFETMGLQSVGSVAAAEGSAAGSIRDAAPRDLSNGITDFIGQDNETSAMGRWETGVMSPSAEGSAAGSLRTTAKGALSNGTTDFIGRDNETSSYE